MKKILAVALALTMLFALCVPAFAADVSVDAAGDYNVPVKTICSSSDESFTVTYPAAMEIPWGTVKNEDGTYPAEATFTYSVVSHLQTGKTITVAVTAKNDSKMTSGAGETLAYTLAGDLNATTATAVVAADDFVKTVNVDIAQAAWDAAPVDEYTGTVTYAVTVNPAP